MLNNTVAFSGFKVGECARFSPAQSPPPTSTSACRKHTNCCWFSKSCNVCVYMQVCKPICSISVMPFSSLSSSYRYILHCIYTVYGKLCLFSKMSVDLKSDFSYFVLSLSFILQFCLFTSKWFYNVSVTIKSETPIHIRTFLDTICVTE